MCRTKLAVRASVPTHLSSFARSSIPTTNTTANTKPSSSSISSSTSSALSLLSVRDLLPEKPHIYSPSEILSATNNLLTKQSSSSWRCILHGRDVLVFQRRFLGDPNRIAARLSSISRSHHTGLARLLGASLAAPDSLFLVYEHVPGASLAHCLRNPRNPNFTPLATWTSRIQIAADVAKALEYIHHHARAIHNRIKSSAIVVTNPDLRARICHFGPAELPGEIDQASRIDGTRGYISPEIRSGGAPSQGSDVYAFGVMLLELVSGEEPVSYRYERDRLEVVSVVESARKVMVAGEEEERRRSVRRWVDRRLRDSFPVEVAERVVRIALECVEYESERRPEMGRVAVKLSGLLFKSREWAGRVQEPTEISVSAAPR